MNPSEPRPRASPIPEAQTEPGAYLDEPVTAPDLQAIDDVPEEPAPIAAANNGSDGDLEARFDLGLAYKEMGMLDEAITEFAAAAQKHERMVESFAQMGHCTMAKSEWIDAVGYFQVAVESGAPPKLVTELRYEIGKCYDSASDPDKALYFYGLAFKDDPDFRDVRQRIIALGGNPDDNFLTDDAIKAVNR